MSVTIPTVRCDVCLLPLEGVEPSVWRHRGRCSNEYMRDFTFYNKRAKDLGIDKEHDAAYVARRANK